MVFQANLILFHEKFKNNKKKTHEYDYQEMRAQRYDGA